MAHDSTHSHGRHGHRGHGAHGHDAAQGARHDRDRKVFQDLLRHHDRIERQVEQLENGIRSTTTSDDPEIAALIKTHVAEMHRRMGEGFGLRHWDPAFPEIFAQADKVDMKIEPIEAGIVVTETSTDANVVRLIHTHGDIVSGFVAGGGRVASQPTPLPEDYVRARS